MWHPVISTVIYLTSLLAEFSMASESPTTFLFSFPTTPSLSRCLSYMRGCPGHHLDYRALGKFLVGLDPDREEQRQRAEEGRTGIFQKRKMLGEV